MTVDRVIDLRGSESALLRRLFERGLCRSGHASCHALLSPPKVAGISDRSGGELYRRGDNREDSARRRLAVDFAQTLPVLAYYRERGTLTEVNVDQPRGQVTRVRHQRLLFVR